MNTDGFHVRVIDINGTPYEIHDWKYSDKMQSGIDILAVWRKSDNRYLVRVSEEGDLFDPLDSTNNIDKRDRERGGRFWKFKRCSKECYRQYTTFLRSKSRTPYLVAQRRLRNELERT